MKFLIELPDDAGTTEELIHGIGEALLQKLELANGDLIYLNHRPPVGVFDPVQAAIKAAEPWLTKDEVLDLLKLLEPEHDGSDFESNCPSCTAYVKLTAAIKAKGAQGEQAGIYNGASTQDHPAQGYFNNGGG